jgi:prophage regulatory protein
MTKRKLTQRAGVEEITGYGRSWITETINPESDRYDPTFPKPFKIANTQTNIWVVDEVYAWVDAQIEKGRVNQTESESTERQNTAQ